MVENGIKTKDASKRKDRIRINIYGSSLGISLTALIIAVIMEVIMILYTVFNREMYGPYLWRYRGFYISLLVIAVAFIALALYVKKDIQRRYIVMNYASPICTVLFFAWALAVTYSDMTVTGIVDPTVFMTFSLIASLSFYLFPSIYAAIDIASDSVLLYLIVASKGSVGQLINVLIFLIFQFVLGISFLHLKTKFAERIVNEQDAAGMDEMTGFLNRRSYEEDMKAYRSAPVPEDLLYIVIDLNGLKSVNDKYGHDAGDKMIIGAARCLEQCIGAEGKLYRIGGDEYAVILISGQEEKDKLFRAFEESMRAWSDENGISLSASFGCASAAEFPGKDVTVLAKEADVRMYAAKEEHYKTSGQGRRRYMTECD